jgi:hypothetical protein
MIAGELVEVYDAPLTASLVREAIAAYAHRGLISD